MIFTVDQILAFFLIFARLAGVVMTAPFFNNRQIFIMAKIAFVFWTAGLMIFVVPLPLHGPTTGVSMILAVVGELFIGVMLGFTADMVVMGLEFAGALIDTQAGLSVASLLDPSTGRNSALFEMFLRWVALMVFIQVDGHHVVLTAVHKSFSMVPIGSAYNLTQGSWAVLGFASDIFKSAVLISAPVLLVVFLVDFSFGILNRVAEQINVFQLGFQVKPTVSVIVFLAMVPGLLHLTLGMMSYMMENLIHVLVALQGGPGHA
jgi:flagellar biosynthetic protein FliR